MNKTDLGIALGIGRQRIYQWGDRVPQYAIAFLQTQKKLLATEEKLATMEKVKLLIKDHL